ncbi:MAG: terminase [Burkholderiales bacterium]
MSATELPRWQWEAYPRYHRSLGNLLLHIVLVPLFLVANVALVAALIRGSWLVALVAAGAMVASIALQGRGHRFEALPPEPFTGPGNAVLRIFLEQWVTFPGFVLRGGWLGALRNAPTA